MSVAQGVMDEIRIIGWFGRTLSVGAMLPNPHTALVSDAVCIGDDAALVNNEAGRSGRSLRCHRNVTGKFKGCNDNENNEHRGTVRDSRELGVCLSLHLPRHAVIGRSGSTEHLFVLRSCRSFGRGTGPEARDYRPKARTRGERQEAGYYRHGIRQEARGTRLP
jgi:hypothetical protein